MNGQVVDIETLARQPLGRAIELRPLDDSDMIRFGVSAYTGIWVEVVVR